MTLHLCTKFQNILEFWYFRTCYSNVLRKFGFTATKTSTQFCPQNILVRECLDSDDLTGVVADFGLAAPIPASMSDRLSQVGSPYWMSPECLNGEFYNGQVRIFCNCCQIEGT